MKLSDLKGVGPKKEAILNSMGIETVQDLLYHLPSKFEDRRVELDPFSMEPGWFEARVIRINKWFQRGKKQMLVVDCQSAFFRAKVIFFNAPFLQKAFSFQKDYIFYGKPERKTGYLQFVHPAFLPLEKKDEFKRLIAHYSVKKGISSNEFASFVELAFKAPFKPFFLKEDLNAWELMEEKEALYELHFPTGDRERYKRAKYTLVFEDFFRYLILNRSSERKARAPYNFHPSILDRFMERIPFTPTESQIQGFKEILHDMNLGSQMIRLVQGDVGSGKSVLAYFACYLVLTSNHQAAYMAPTELLATEQYERMKDLFSDFKVELITSSTKNKKALYERLASGEIELLVGTHAMFQDKVVFKNVDLFVIDEQQRFGVEQRETLMKKGELAHVLMLSATPIPRTMSMLLNKNLDLTIISEKPMGRKPIKTELIREDEIEKAYEVIDREVKLGHRAFIVYPLIEESDALDARSIEGEEEKLRTRFGNSIEFLHGRMTSEEKIEIIERFRTGEKPILAATSLIEVGIDVKEATVIVIRNSDRFGLSQIHQLRGRIGRNEFDSYCFLTYEKGAPKERLQVLEDTQDGFLIAEKDLELRGPGELLGTKQSGSIDFPIADLFKHRDVLKRVDEILTDEVLQRYKKNLLEERVKL
ncbi:ATP-dependent DNA helicase RecG [Guggenheimella bovis]